MSTRRSKRVAASKDAPSASSSTKVDLPDDLDVVKAKRAKKDVKAQNGNGKGKEESVEVS